MTRLVVNAHWHGEQIVEAMARRADAHVTVQEEAALLETGGGVKLALPKLGNDPFAVVNGDAFWLDGPTPALTRLAAIFDPAEMDALLLMVRTTQVEGVVGRGDFLLDPIGRIRRPKEREIAPYLYAGVQILNPTLFEGAPDGAFSLNTLYDKAIENGRLFGLVHDGLWFHLSTPEDLENAEDTLRAGLVRALF